MVARYSRIIHSNLDVFSFTITKRNTVSSQNVKTSYLAVGSWWLSIASNKGHQQIFFFMLTGFCSLSKKNP